MEPEQAQQLDADVVLVVGPMRSGTTLLAEALDTHPEVTYLGFELAEEWSVWTGLPWGAPGSDDVTCPPLDTDDVTPRRMEAVRAGIAALLGEVAPAGRDRPTVVLKSPHFWHRLPFLCTVLPEAGVVRARRRLLPTVASMRRLWDRALRDHGRVHHLPTDPMRCWDFVSADRADDYPPDRTFPSGKVEVLAEFIRRVDDELDRFLADHPRRVRAEVWAEDMVTDFERTTAGLQQSLGLPTAQLSPPSPLEPARLQEWRTLLTREERDRLAPVAEA